MVLYIIIITSSITFVHINSTDVINYDQYISMTALDISSHIIFKKKEEKKKIHRN